MANTYTVGWHLKERIWGHATIRSKLPSEERIWLKNSRSFISKSILYSGSYHRGAIIWILWAAIFHASNFLHQQIEELKFDIEAGSGGVKRAQTESFPVLPRYCIIYPVNFDLTMEKINVGCNGLWDRRILTRSCLTVLLVIPRRIGEGWIFLQLPSRLHIQEGDTAISCCAWRKWHMSKTKTSSPLVYGWVRAIPMLSESGTNGLEGLNPLCREGSGYTASCHWTCLTFWHYGFPVLLKKPLSLFYKTERP